MMNCWVILLGVSGVTCTPMHLKPQLDSLKKSFGLSVMTISSMIKNKADLYFILTALAQVVSCVHMNEVTRSNSNINNKKQ